jgi:excisionase family DNA binding protein
MTVWETPVEAAERTRQSADLIRAAVKSGDLPAYPVGKGRDYRLDADEVDIWMKSRSWEPRSA